MIVLSFYIGTNHIYQELCKAWPEAESWAAKCNVFKKGQFQEFDGPGCDTLLKDASLDILDSMTPFPSTMIRGYAQTFRCLSKVVKGSFSWTVAPNIRDDISQFRQSYLKLNISVTPKVNSLSIKYSTSWIF